MLTLTAVLWGCTWKQQCTCGTRENNTSCNSKKCRVGSGFEKIHAWLLISQRQKFCCVAGYDTNSMDKFFYPYTLNIPCDSEMMLDPLTSRTVIWVVITSTQKPPALSHFTPPGIFFTEHPFFFSDSSRPNAFHMLLCSLLGSIYRRMGRYTMTYPYPTSHWGYAVALSHVTANLRLQISYPVFSVVLLL